MDVKSSPVWLEDTAGPLRLLDDDGVVDEEVASGWVSPAPNRDRRLPPP